MTDPRTPAPADGPRPDYVRDAVADLEALFTRIRIGKLQRDFFHPPTGDATGAHTMTNPQAPADGPQPAALVRFPRNAPVYMSVATPGQFRATAIRAADTFFDTNPGYQWVKVSVCTERGPEHAYYYFSQGLDGRAELLTNVAEAD
jgi:hypothetical protein